jgi:hypothetical protein
VCVKVPIDGSSCAVELDGQACSSCIIKSGYDFIFDCTNVADGFSLGSGDSFASLPVIQACYQPVNGQYCDLCSYGSSIRFEDYTPISLSGFGDSFTCSGLSEAGMYNQISVEKHEQPNLGREMPRSFRFSQCGMLWIQMVRAMNDYRLD